MSDPLVRATDLVRSYRARGGRFRAVDDVSLQINSGETLGLVGESGSGKSTVGRLLIGMEPADHGSIDFGGKNLGRMRGRERKRLRRDAAMVFQDPYSALDPRWTIERVVAEPLVVAGVPSAERHERVLKALTLVGLAEEHLTRRPREFSGGQRQRIAVARALVSEPKLIVCDESVSALDVSTQAQVLGLLEDLQDRLGVAYLFISHDLHVIRRVSDRVAVMYLGRIIEEGPADDVVADPRHPYTAALVSASPIPDPKLARSNRRIILSGSPPSPMDPPSGCVFRTRCPLAMPVCAEKRPGWTDIAPGRRVACHLYANPDLAPRAHGVADLMRAATPSSTLKKKELKEQ